MKKTALVFCLLLALTICQQINLTKAQSSEALLRGLVDDLLKALEFGGRAFGRDFVDILGDIIDNNAFGRLDPYIRQIVEQARDRAVEAGDNFWRRLLARFVAQAAGDLLQRTIGALGK